MKAKAILLALAIIGSGIFAFSQQVVPDSIKIDCDKKVLKKIKRKMAVSKFTDYMEEGTTAKYLVICYVNENRKVELKSIKGNNEALKETIINTFNQQSISYPSETPGNYFTFFLIFKKLPA